MDRTATGFITFEGIEGSGKTTQVRLLSEYLTSKGVQHVVTREPGGTVVGEKIRALLLDPRSRMVPITELLLYGAARAQHIEEVIQPALGEGKVVLCDRFTDATAAYQGAGRQLPMNVIRVLNSLASADIKPDLTLLLDLDPSAGLARARVRNTSAGATSTTRFDDEEIAFHTRVRDGYLEIAREEATRVRVIAADSSPEKVAKQILTHVKRRLSLG
ncbi:MAG: dTMP kinase [Acidobacteria bacterium]|nr:dTMP kinase [Acidobacteriota bacterium]